MALSGPYLDTLVSLVLGFPSDLQRGIRLGLI